MFGRIVTGLLRFMLHCLRLLKKMIFQKANIANTLLRYLVQEPFPIRTCLNFYCHCPLYALHWCSDIPHMPGTCATYDLACQVPKKSPSQKLFAYYVWSTSVCSQRTRSYGPLLCWNLRRPFPAEDDCWQTFWSRKTCPIVPHQHILRKFFVLLENICHACFLVRTHRG